MREFGRVELSRVGKGWGGLVPCGDVVRGVLRYYVVGVDASGSPAATAGDARHPYFVRIRPSITAEQPSLPGQPPPKKCAPGTPPPPVQSTPRPGETHEKAPEEEKSKPAGPGTFARVWVGFGASLDVTSFPAATDVCKSQGNPYYCTDPRGSDYPSDPTTTFVNNRAGNVGGGLTASDVRVFAALDYAITANLLAGARLGLVANSYPGTAASQAGHAFSIPLHAEARITYAFGDAPLAHPGVAPIIIGALGVGRFDASTVVQVGQSGIVGDRPTLAWNTGGPFFVALGGGARYAFSPRVAFSAIAKASAATGGGGLFPTLAPEIGLQYGF
jgi:hypothetical protein